METYRYKNLGLFLLNTNIEIIRTGNIFECLENVCNLKNIDINKILNQVIINKSKYLKDSHGKFSIRNMEIIKYLQELINLDIILINKNITDDKDIYIYKNYYIKELNKLQEELEEINIKKEKVKKKYDYLFNRKKIYESNDYNFFIDFNNKLSMKDQYVPILNNKNPKYFDEIINTNYLYEINDKNKKCVKEKLFNFKDINGYYDLKNNKNNKDFTTIEYNDFIKINKLEELKKIRKLKNSIIKNYIFRIEKDGDIYIMKNENTILNINHFFKGNNPDNIKFKKEYNKIHSDESKCNKEINNIKSKYLNQTFKFLNENVEDIIPLQVKIIPYNTLLLEDEYIKNPLKTDEIRIKKNSNSEININIINNRIKNITENKYINLNNIEDNENTQTFYELLDLYIDT